MYLRNKSGSKLDSCKYLPTILGRYSTLFGNYARITSTVDGYLQKTKDKLCAWSPYSYATPHKESVKVS